jgi:hypothetical protein
MCKRVEFFDGIARALNGHVTALFLTNERAFRGSRAEKSRNLLQGLPRRVPGVALRTPYLIVQLLIKFDIQNIQKSCHRIFCVWVTFSVESRDSRNVLHMPRLRRAFLENQSNFKTYSLSLYICYVTKVMLSSSFSPCRH